MAVTLQEVRVESHARVTGAVYLSYFVLAILGLLLASHKIPAGAFVNGLSTVNYAAVTILIYRLFRGGQPLLALAAAASSLAGCSIDAVHQLHFGFANVSPLAFFGPFCMLLGILIVRSGFLPRWLAWPLIVAGIGWLAYLVPGVAQHAKIVIFPIGFTAEFELMLWLLLRGVDEVRWHEGRC
jgi:Domain of unknown function (DUF4386)